MKKAAKKRTASRLRREYDFSKGVRGKYSARYTAGSNLVRLDSDLAERFPDSETVNRALRSLTEIADRELATPSR